MQYLLNANHDSKSLSKVPKPPLKEMLIVMVHLHPKKRPVSRETAKRI
jgi:hypothetical protein